MTDEGDHGGASVIDGRTRRSAPTPGYDGSRRGGPLCPPTMTTAFSTESSSHRLAAMPAPFHKGAYWCGTSDLPCEREVARRSRDGRILSLVPRRAKTTSILTLALQALRRSPHPALRATCPIPFVPVGHFPLTRGNVPRGRQKNSRLSAAVFRGKFSNSLSPERPGCAALSAPPFWR